MLTQQSLIKIGYQAENLALHYIDCTLPSACTNLGSRCHHKT